MEVIDSLLRKGADKIGLELSDIQIAQFISYTRLLLDWNEKINLTRITDLSDIVVKHFLDSLTCLKAVNVKKGSHLVDVGTGAGFPGVPVAIARPDIKAVLMDATLKRLNFLKAVKEELIRIAEKAAARPPQIELVQSRAEDAGRSIEHRERYDLAVARAVAEMRVLVEYCLPLVKTGGNFIAMKGCDIDQELESAKPAIGTLGGAAPKVEHITLPDTDIHRSLIVIRKIRQTPEQFPRHGSRIVKKPL